MEDPAKVTYFATTNTRGKQTPFGIRRRDRARHMYVIGKTGVGKSTLLENMAIQDIRNGEGLAFIDPHGTTADRIMEYVPPHRIKDVIYFAPFDMDYPVAFNVMEDVGYDKRHLVVSGLLSAFRKIWVDAWSARMEYILSNTLLALLEYPDSTLLDVNRMLVDKVFRKKVVENIQDPIVRSFWVDEFAGYTDRYTQEATPAIQNKIGQFTSNPLIRNIVGQPKSSFDIRRAMDEKKILIMNLSKGRVGEVNATLLGSMLVTKIYLSAMSRADVPASVLAALPNFYFYVDEFQNFANESFADILSEARKYKLNLIIAHQYVEQMEEEVRDAVFGNVGTTVAFRVGPFDAETLETIFAPQFTKEDLVNLGKGQIYLTLMIDDIGSPPFSAETLPPFDPSPQNLASQATDASRTAYGRPRAEVEKSIAERQQPEVPVRSAADRDERPRTVARNIHENRSSAGDTAPRRAPMRESSERREPRPAAPAQSSDRPRHDDRSREERRPEPYMQDTSRREERPERQAPPGIHSLREAIAKATADVQTQRKADAPRREESPRPPRQTAPAVAAAASVPALPSSSALRAALDRIAPSAIGSTMSPQPVSQSAASKPAVRSVLSQHQSRAQSSAPAASPASSPKRKPAGIPNDELKEMLSVDPLQ